MALKFKTKYGIIDADKEPIVIIFKNDEERIAIANQIRDGFVAKEGQRKLAIFPDGMSQQEMEDFMEYGKEIDVTRNDTKEDYFQIVNVSDSEKRMIFSIDIGDSDIIEAQNMVARLRNKLSLKDDKNEEKL